MPTRFIIVLLPHSTNSELPNRSNLIHSLAVPPAFFFPFPAAAIKLLLPPLLS
uniref:Uncharacterized protein n=1 Tax=Rhizophora mucronata TaxID=61149 RepID=A0A2P2L0D6_RHIMU